MSDSSLSQDDQESLKSDMALMQPSFFLPELMDAIQDEVAFFSHDLSGKVVYISKHAPEILNLCPVQWRVRAFWDILSDDPSNEGIRSWAPNSENSAAGFVCEIMDREGTRLKLKCWRVAIEKDGEVIGVGGILRRLREKATQIESTTEKELIARVKSLTKVEYEVIDMAVDGMMNKEMAIVLNVAVRTIESRRSRAMSKLKTKSLTELVQTWMEVRRLLTNGMLADFRPRIAEFSHAAREQSHAMKA